MEAGVHGFYISQDARYQTSSSIQSSPTHVNHTSRHTLFVTIGDANSIVRRFIMKAMRLMLVALALGLAGMGTANAHDNVGFSISIGSPGYYYAPPPPVYFGPPPIYQRYTPRIYYHYDRPYYYGGYRDHYYRGHGPHGFRGHGGPGYGHGHGHR